VGGALASHCGRLCCVLGAMGYGEEGGLWDEWGERSLRFALRKIVLRVRCYGLR